MTSSLSDGQKKSYKPVVQTDSTGKWYGNALRFETREEAELSAYLLMQRWTLVLDCGSEESEDPVNYKLDMATGQLEALKVTNPGP